MSIVIPKIEQVDFLVSRKFPNAQNVETAYRRPQPINTVTSRNNSKNGRIFAELELRYEAIQEYRNELAVKLPEEIEALFIQEQRKYIDELRLKAEQEERGRFFNQPAANADFEFWSKTKHWTLDEAIALSFGKSPRVVYWNIIATWLSSSSPFALKYAEVRELALRATV